MSECKIQRVYPASSTRTMDYIFDTKENVFFTLDIQKANVSKLKNNNNLFGSITSLNDKFLDVLT